MNVSLEFSKNAIAYSSYNTIQNMVIEKLLSDVNQKPKKILDLGCGNGGLCRAVKWEYDHFTGVDFSYKMLELHPKSDKVEPIFGDFNSGDIFDFLSTSKYDYIFSASALQWADDLEFVFKNIKKLNAPFALAIFTSNTFKTINKTASINSILREPSEIDFLQKKYFNAEFELVSYKLEFASTREMFKYIKKSGVSGARRVLSYKESKRLLNEYPLNYLEFEVAFIYSTR